MTFYFHQACFTVRRNKCSVGGIVTDRMTRKGKEGNELLWNVESAFFKDQYLYLNLQLRPDFRVQTVKLHAIGPSTDHLAYVLATAFLDERKQ